jgi:hypothetical protein
MLRVIGFTPPRPSTNKARLANFSTKKGDKPKELLKDILANPNLPGRKKKLLTNSIPKHIFENVGMLETTEKPEYKENPSESKVHFECKQHIAQQLLSSSKKRNMDISIVCGR